MNYIKKNYWRLFFGLYVFIYMPWFFYLEKTITISTPGLNIIEVPLDKSIPFCEYFIIPYVLWFFYIAICCVYMFLKASDSEYLKFAFSLIIGMSVALFICMVYPNGLMLRPDYVPDNFLGRIVSNLYITDTSTNVFPSIHVYNSLAVHIALMKCKAMNNHKIIKICSLILCILICLSTMFLKQHSVIDVIGGIVLMCILYILIYVVNYKGLLKKFKKN